MTLFETKKSNNTYNAMTFSMWMGMNMDMMCMCCCCACNLQDMFPPENKLRHR